MLALVVGCTPKELKDARTVLQLTSDACILLSEKSDDKTLNEVCATQQELAPLVNSILSARKGEAPEKLGATACPECPACPTPVEDAEPEKTTDDSAKAPEEPAKKAE